MLLCLTVLPGESDPSRTNRCSGLENECMENDFNFILLNINKLKFFEEVSLLLRVKPVVGNFVTRHKKLRSKMSLKWPGGVLLRQ